MNTTKLSNDDLGFSESQMISLGKKWDKIYKRFIEDLNDLVDEAGGKDKITFNIGEDGLWSIWPVFN